MLNLALLKKARRFPNGSIIAQCPACSLHGHDASGTHLKIDPKGRFCCVLFPGPAGRQHRKDIFSLIGDKVTKPPEPIRKFKIHSTP